MLQPKPKFTPPSDAIVVESKNTFVPPSDAIVLKKKESTESTSTTQEKNLESVQTVGSLDGVGSNGFPAIDVNLGVPGLKPDLKTVEQLANPPKLKQKEIKTPKDLRLANETDFKEMQKQGIAPPNSELRISERVSDTSDNYDLQGNLPTPKAKKVDSVTQTHWNEPFQPKNITATNKELPKDGQYRLPDDYSMKIKTTPEFTEDLYNFTEKDKAEIKKNIDTKIEDNDLDIEHPYLYFSSYNKPSISKDDFVTRTFGEEKLKEIGINIADFDGFLNKKGYKKEFLDKESKGMFEGSGYGKENYNIELAKDIQKNRLLNLYIGEINGRNLAKRKLEKEKSNLEKSSKQISEEGELTPYTLFDQEKLEQFVETEMPTLSKKLKEVDSENKEIYAKHKSGDANLLYGTEKTFKKIGYGFIDKVNQISATVLDKIGADEHAQGLRFLNEQRQISRPNTRDVGYAKGKTTKAGDTNYLVTDEGRIIDQDLKIDVTDLLKDYEVDSIKFSAKEENKSDYTFSPQGSIIQFGGVVGDMIVQLALTKSLSNVVPSLAQIPLSRGMSSAIITQSALGYTQGVSETYKQLIDAGVNEKDAKLIANEAGQNMALLYGVTAPLSPQTKATQAIFGKEGKQLIKEAVKAYTQSGKKGFLETLKSGLSKIPRHAVDWVEEGLIKEGTQELIQQGGESYGVNAEINRQAGQHIVKDTINANEVINTLIQTTLSGGLAVVPNLFTKTDKLKTLSDLSKDANFDSNLNNLVEKGVVTKEQANVLKKDVQVFSNQIGKIPKNLNKNIAMDVMTDLQEIQDLEAKKKTLDKSFHEDIDAEIETKRTLIKDRIKFDALSKKEITELKSTAKKELIQEAKDKDEDVSKIDNAKITERANKIYKANEELKTPTPETQPQAEIKTEVAQVSKSILDLEKQRDDEIEKLKSKRQYDEKNITPIREKYDALILEEKSKDFDLFHTGAEGMSIESVTVDPRVTRQGRKGKYGGFYTYDNIKNIIDFVKGNSTTSIYGIKLNDGVEITDYNGSIERLDAEKLQELRDSGIKVIRGKSLVGKTEIIVVDKSAIKNITKINDTKQNSPTPEAQPQAEVPQQAEAEKVAEVSPVEDVVAKSISKEEYADFVDNNNVSDERLNSISEKVKNQEKLSEQENAIFVGKTSEINKIIADAGKKNGDIAPNGNVRSGTSNVGESGNSKQETPKPQEVSPVEDVVATSVDRKQPTNAKEWEEQNFTKDEIIERRKFGLTPEQEWEPTFRGTSVSEWETIQNGGEFKSEGLNGLVFTTPSKELAKQSGKGVDAEVIIEFKPESKSKMREGDSKYDSKEYYGDSLNKDDVLRVTDKNGNVIYEATSPTNNPVNGNVQSRTSDVGESGITEQQSPAKESVSSSVDGGEVKGDASVVNYANNWVEKTNAELESKGYKGNIKLAPKTEYNGFKVGEIVENKHNDDISHIKGFVEEDGDIRAITTNDKYVHISNLKKADGVARLVFSKFAEIDGDTKKRNELLLNLSEKQKQEINDNYVTLINEGNIKETPKNSDVTNEKTPNRKESRKKIAEAKVDDIVNAINGIDSIFGIKIKVDDVDGLNKNGIDIVNVIASIVKQAVNAGIDVDEAIKKTIEHLKKTIVFDVNINDVKEKLGVEKEISKDELSDFRDLIRDIPQKDEVKNYLSGETIERVYGETPRNDQSYNTVSLADLSLHGKLVMDKAKELFGDQYVEKTLDFLENSNLEADEKAIQYVALENEMDARISENPNDLGERKLQDLVRKKSQAHLRKSAIAINAGRLRAIMKYGIDVDKYPYEILTKKQKEARNKIEKLVQHTSEDINKEAEIQEEEGFVIAEPKAKRDKAIVKSEISDVIKKLRADLIKSARGQSLNVSIPYAEQIKVATPHIIKLSKLFAELGGMKTKEIIDAIHDELSKVFPAIKKSDVSSVLKEVYEEKAKPKDKKIQDIVKQALIDAGFSRKVKIKGEEKTLLDWKKLAGEESSIPKLKANVEKSLKAQGYTNSQIEKISKSLEEEYIRLGADIIQKGLRELENRDKLKPTPTRKTDAKRLSELYNYGLFNSEKSTEYDNLLNKTLGLSEFDVETYQKIKSLAKALASVYNQENNGRKISEIAVQTLNSTINHQIKSLLATSALKNGTKAFNVASAFDDYVGLSMRALLGSVSTLTENKISGEFQVQLQKAFSSGEITPELKKQIEADKKAVFRDITRNAGLFYGDTNTSLTHSSRFEEWLNGKADKAMAHTVVSSFLLRAFLDGVDSSVKVRLTQKAFVKNVIKLLTSETNPNGKMSTEEAIKYVSEQLTGENFEKALKTAKSIIENVNEEQGEKVIKDTDEAIHRFAMDLVKENLLSSNMLTMDNIESAYKSAYKSAGRSIGHEANNIISAGVNLLSSTLNKRLEKAIQEKNYALATSLTLLATIQKSIVNPFVGGGTNWVILGLEKSGNPLGYISVIHNATERRKLDLSENKTDITQSLYRESVYKDSAVRLLVGTGIAMATFVALTAGDDDEELLGKLNQWLKDNPWAKKHFNKLAPEAVTFLIDMKNGELSKHWQKILGMKNDYFDNIKTLINTFSDENSSMSGAFGAFVGQNLSSPGPWKTIKDVRDILRGLKGLPEIKTDYKTSGFWNGYFRAGLVDFAKLRPGVNYDLNSKIDKVKDDEKKLNSEIDSFVKYIYDEKLSDAEINKKIDEKFSAQPLKKERIKESIKNRAEEEKLKRSGVDPFYIRLKRASNDEIKAILFQDRFKDLNKTTPAEQKEIEKGMNAIKFGEGSKEFWDTYWRLAHPENYKNKPVN